MKRVLVVVSQLTGTSPTGVEAHFNLIMDLAGQNGIQAVLVTPHGGFSIWKKVSGVVSRLVGTFSKEYRILWVRWAGAWRIKHRLGQTLAKFPGADIVLYAQDPLSAKIALSLRREFRFRLVCVVHFNVSEADEVAAKRITRKGGALWRNLVKLERDALPRVDKLLFVSNFMRKIVNNRLSQLGSVPQQTLANFVPRPRPSEGTTLSGDLIAIGTLEPRKNQAFLLRVLARCNELGKRYSLTVVGDGPDRRSLEDSSRQLNVGDQVRFVGHLSHAARHIPSHRLLVHAALRENLPVTLLEAFSHGIPVVAVPVGGIPEIIQDGVEGRFWNLADVDASARVLMEILENDRAYGDMKAAALRKYETCFSVDVLGPRWLAALYDTTPPDVSLKPGSRP